MLGYWCTILLCNLTVSSASTRRATSTGGAVNLVEAFSKARLPSSSQIITAATKANPGAMIRSLLGLVLMSAHSKFLLFIRDCTRDQYQYELIYDMLRLFLILVHARTISLHDLAVGSASTSQATSAYDGINFSQPRSPNEFKTTTASTATITGTMNAVYQCLIVKFTIYACLNRHL